MSAKIIKLGDKTTRILFNPFPAITEKEFLNKDPKLRFFNGRRPTDAPLFKMEIKYGSSTDIDFLTLGPGEESELPRVMAETLYRLGRYLGLVMVAKDATEGERFEAVQSAFAERLAWEATNGSLPLEKRQLQYNASEWDRVKYSRHAGLVSNALRESLVQEIATEHREEFINGSAVPAAKAK